MKFYVLVVWDSDADTYSSSSAISPPSDYLTEAELDGTARIIVEETDSEKEHQESGT